MYQRAANRGRFKYLECRFGGRTPMGKLKRREFIKRSGVIPLGVAGITHIQMGKENRLPPDAFDPWLEINLDHLTWNLEQIRKRVNPRPVMAVIKANGYGHGLLPVAHHLEKQKIAFMAVGKFAEALALREGGIKTPILNLGPLPENGIRQMISMRISQSVYSDQIESISAVAAVMAKRARIHIKIDTGLGRVGIPHGRAANYIKRAAVLRGIDIEGIFTTFTEDTAFDSVQLERFNNICRTAQNTGINIGLKHAASSAGILSFPQAFLDMVRPGITLFGHYPSTDEYQKRRIELRPSMTLKARVGYVKTLQPGESVSYHRAFTATRGTPVATLPLGYSDGYRVQPANKGMVLIQGKRVPLIAAVTANHVSLDLSRVGSISAGAEVVLLGRQGNEQISGEEYATWSDCSVYKALIGMNPLLPRLFTRA